MPVSKYMNLILKLYIYSKPHSSTGYHNFPWRMRSISVDALMKLKI